MDELAKLETERKRAGDRVSSVEREWREALEASRQVSAELAHLERTGGSATARKAAEEKLTEAKRLADQPWPERLQGARDARQDADRAYRTYVAAHLGELVEELEVAGETAAENVNTAAAALIAASLEWQAVAGRISATISLVARPSTADVSRSRVEADEAARAAIALVNVGGEVGPRLDRTRPPWATLLGEDERRRGR